jgi:hypothetical protein
VYNNFPWAENISETQEKNIEKLAQEILNIREKNFADNASLADLYDRKEKFENDTERVGWLFELYENLVKKNMMRISPNKIYFKYTFSHFFTIINL